MLERGDWVRALRGPIVVLGAAGFVGANLLRQLLKYREDVFGVVRSLPAWRLDGIDRRHILEADLNDLSGTRLRDALTGAIGEGPYMGLFSLASLAALVWMIVAFGQARGSPENLGFWGISHATRDPAILLVLLGFLLMVPGLLTNSPTRVRGGGQVDKPEAATGMTRITRHPFLWGVAVWACGHLLANGRLADFILFGSLLVLAIFGTYSIDAKRTRALGDRYEAFKAKTSNIPFAAVIQGRQSFKLGEIWWRLVVAIVVWAAVLWLHPYFTGGVHPLG